MPDNDSTPERPDQPGQPDQPQRPEDLWLLDRILHGDVAPEDLALAELLAAASGPPTAAELRGEQAARAAFAAHQQGRADAARTTSRPRRYSMVSALKASKVAAAAAVGGIALASSLTAAYAGALPAGLQDFAHHTIGAQPADDGQGETGDPGDSPDGSGDEPTGAPTPTSTSTAASTPVGPDATGSPAFGLCTAWSHGGLAPSSVAYRSLVTAAGDEAGIAAYCATVAHPGSTATHPGGSPTSHPGGSPSTHPGGSPTSHPGGSPSTHQGGKPTSHPTH